MRALVQRVTHAEVRVGDRVCGRIGPGLAILLAVESQDAANDALALANKIAHLRIFSDRAGLFNLSGVETGAAALVVPQFTLYADVRKGRRPSFTRAAPPAVAEPLVQDFCDALRALGLPVQSGVFGAHMLVEIHNDGPVTIWLDTDELARPRRSHSGDSVSRAPAQVAPGDTA